jgi:4-diphosphocytidyl-2-C-methyl-D-erythritol kinase
MQTGPCLTEIAKAKVNLDLRITGIRRDGYHLLDSIVVFPNIGDEVSFTPHVISTENINSVFTVSISGEFAQELSLGADNLIIKAAKLLSAGTNTAMSGHFHLVKNLPVSSGIGGGSADAAAVMRLLIKAYGLEITADKLLQTALKIGADVPICFKSTSSIMRGIGDEVSGFHYDEPLHILLINPLKPVSTQEVFKLSARQRSKFSSPRRAIKQKLTTAELIQCLKNSSNDLETAAQIILPDIKGLLNILGDTNALVFGMSGSGATCFALYRDDRTITKALIHLKDIYNNYWIASGVI